MNELNPFEGEVVGQNKIMLETIEAQLEMIARRVAYLLELKEYYENLGDISPDVQASQLTIDGF